MPYRHMDTDLLVALSLHFADRGDRSQQCNAAAWKNSFFDRCPRRMKGVFHCVLSSASFRLRSGTDGNDCHAASHFGKSFLELLAIVFAFGASSDGESDHTHLDLVFIPGTINDRAGVLGHFHLLGTAELRQFDRFQLDPQIFRRSRFHRFESPCHPSWLCVDPRIQAPSPMWAAQFQPAARRWSIFAAAWTRARRAGL